MSAGKVSVKLLNFLRLEADSRGLASDIEIETGPEGIVVDDIIERLGVSAEQVEAAFLNGKARGLDARAYPGDRVALLPPGAPGPYRVLLGLRGEKPGDK